eukprot:scaffold26708_cov107-Isochrysis_galbana.AAC.1
MAKARRAKIQLMAAGGHKPCVDMYNMPRWDSVMRASRARTPSLSMPSSLALCILLDDASKRRYFTSNPHDTSGIGRGRRLNARKPWGEKGAVGATVLATPDSEAAGAK